MFPKDYPNWIKILYSDGLVGGELIVSKLQLQIKTQAGDVKQVFIHEQEQIVLNGALTNVML